MAHSRTLADMASSSSMESAIREAENLRDALKVASAIRVQSVSDQQVRRWRRYPSKADALNPRRYP